MYLKRVLKPILICIDFSSPGGACRPGFARETERASANSCDSHGLSNDSGANNGLLIVLMILRADCHELSIILMRCSVISAILIRSGPKMLPYCLQCSQHGPNRPKMVKIWCQDRSLERSKARASFWNRFWEGLGFHFGSQKDLKNQPKSILSAL